MCLAVAVQAWWRRDCVSANLAPKWPNRLRFHPLRILVTMEPRREGAERVREGLAVVSLELSEALVRSVVAETALGAFPWHGPNCK